MIDHNGRNHCGAITILFIFSHRLRRRGAVLYKRKIICGRKKS